MTEADLPAVEAWLRLPHVARWWTPDTTAEAEIAKYRERVRPDSKPTTHMLMVTLDSTPIGWCQWYRWADYPAGAEAMDARDGEIGIDYAIGDPAQVGRGVGTTLIATLTTEIRRRHPGADTGRPGRRQHRLPARPGEEQLPPRGCPAGRH